MHFVSHPLAPNSLLIWFNCPWVDIDSFIFDPDNFAFDLGYVWDALPFHARTVPWRRIVGRFSNRTLLGVFERLEVFAAESLETGGLLEDGDFKVRIE